MIDYELLTQKRTKLNVLNSAIGNQAATLESGKMLGMVLTEEQITELDASLKATGKDLKDLAGEIKTLIG